MSKLGGTQPVRNFTAFAVRQSSSLLADNQTACRLIKDLMKEAQLDVREDIMGNIFGRWEGAEKAAGAGLSGTLSHIEDSTKDLSCYVPVMPHTSRVPQTDVFSSHS